MGNTLLRNESLRAGVFGWTRTGAEAARSRRLVRPARSNQHRLCRTREHEQRHVDGPRQNCTVDARFLGPEVDRVAGVSIQAAGLFDGSAASVGEDFDHGKCDERHGIQAEFATRTPCAPVAAVSTSSQSLARSLPRHKRTASFHLLALPFQDRLLVAKFQTGQQAPDSDRQRPVAY